jgi:hypothetical protein
VKNRGLVALEAPPKRPKIMKYMKVLFIRKMKCAARSRVSLIADGALDRRPVCVRLYAVRSNAMHSITRCEIDRT